MVHLPPFQASAKVWFCVVPTVTQAVAEVHDTPAGRTRGASPGGPGGTGRRWIVHRMPFQCSAIPNTPPSWVPTAVQAVGEAQDTAVSTVYPKSRTLGVGWTAHRTPFQRSARVRARLAEEPTAVHAVGDVHDTPLSSLAREGFGVRTNCQRVPFHISASVMSR